MIARAQRALFLWLSNRRWLGRLAMATPLIWRMPYRFVAGTTLDQAVEAVRALNATGATATLDVLGESVEDRAAADRAAADYVAAIERIASEGLDANVSIKLTQMGLDLGNEECLAALAPVVAAGERHGVFIRIDMEGSAYTQRTLDIVERLRAGGNDVGPVIQSYLFRSVADVEHLATERVRTRVWGPTRSPRRSPTRSASHRRRLRGADEAPSRGRCLPRSRHPRFRDDRARHPLVRERDIGADRYEFQMLYGVRRDFQRQLLADGHRLRVYVPLH